MTRPFAPAPRAALALALAACRAGDAVVEIEGGDPHAFTRDERRAIEEVAARAVPDVRRLLPALPSPIVVRVESGTKVIPETGETATAEQPDVVHWRVDASRPEGVAAIARAQLRPSLFHELHHLVRGAARADRSLRDHVIREGLADAFERDQGGGAPPPWAQYPPEVDQWAAELLALPDDTPRAVWLFEHPDGRRWIGHKVGTYLVDRATKASGKTSAELARTPTDEIIALARGAPPVPSARPSAGPANGAPPSPGPK